MPDLIVGVHTVDFVLIFLLCEGVLLTILYQRRGIGVAPARLWPMLAAGAGLLLALRAGLAGASGYWVGAGLLLALAAHLYDLRGRWQPHID